MKKLIIPLIILLINGHSWGQIDEKSISTLNSLELSKETFPDFELISNYYPIQNNVANYPNFKSDLSENQQYIQIATGFPSYFFTIKSNERVLIAVTLSQKYVGSKNTYFYHICNLRNGETIEISSNLSGDIVEHRAKELIELEIDNNARINSIVNVGSEIYFDGRSFKILEFERIMEDVIKLVSKEFKLGTD